MKKRAAEHADRWASAPAEWRRCGREAGIDPQRLCTRAAAILVSDEWSPVAYAFDGVVGLLAATPRGPLSPSPGPADEACGAPCVSFDSPSRMRSHRGCIERPCSV